jgi:signal transduction histidine kinase/ActR/RegA family two-component response regulator
MSVTIRSRLLLLVLAVLLPAAVAVTWLLATTYASERAAHTRTLHDSARALSMVVDREINRRVAVAHVLAQSSWLDAAPDPSPEQLLNFERIARRALADMEGWVELRAPGRVLLDTRLAAAAARPESGETASAAPAELITVAQVQPLQFAGENGFETHAAVIEPVERGGATLLNLVLTLRPLELQRIIDAQELPPGWMGTVIDNRGIVVARQPGGSAYIGRVATPDLLERLSAESEGQFDSVSLDGQHTTGYFSTSSQGWTYISAKPRAQFADVLVQAIAQVGLGALVLMGLAALGALWVSRRIVVPVYQLKASAARIQAGEPVEARPTGIVECDEVASALAEAGEAIRHGRSALERQVADAVERTRVAEQRAAQSQRVEALGRLTGGVAHDFNNLLGVISNSAHLIQRHPAAPELQVPLAATLRAVEVGSQLTQHLLRFAGRRPVRPQKVHLERFLPEVLELIRSVLGRHIEISVHVAPDTEPVRVDGGELELALINLALNARDAMPAGGAMRLRARNAEPEESMGLGGPPHRRYVLIVVGDDGVGIAPEVAERVFEPFFTTKGVGRGTGLGLSQVHGFCAQAAGAAWLESTPGVGTTVSLLLPADDGSAEPAARVAPAATTVTPLVAGAEVLLVDDNEELARVTAALLQSHGADVHRVGDAAQALRRLDEGPPVDVVLSDIVMPGAMDGVALARQLRRERPGLPVVLISGYSQAAASATDLVVLQKPCPADELLRALQDALATGDRRILSARPPGAARFGGRLASSRFPP